MAEGENSTSAPKTAGFKNLTVIILTTILVTGGLVAAFGTYLKDKFVSSTTFYTCNITLRNGPNATLSDVKVMLNSDSGRTDNYGNVIFRKKKNVYRISFSFGNKPYSKNCSIESDTSLTIDIGASLTNPVTGETVKSNLPQPDKKPEQKKVIENPKSIKITSTQKEQFTPPPPTTQTNITSDTTTQEPIDIKPPTANEILQQLQLKVRIDKNDSYKNRKQQFAYHYYLSGNKEYLDKIKEVLYQRNHSTFPEFQNNRFNVSDERETNFKYIGYQWGSVTSTYVQIIFKNGSKSDIFLKDIIYE